LSKFLHREDSPFEKKVWERIDEVVVASAKSQLSARRILNVEGPYGLALKFLYGSDVTQDDSAKATVSLSKAIPIVAINQSFSLPARDIAAFEQQGIDLNLKAAAEAAMACARREEELLYVGSKSLGVDGLLTRKGTQSIKLQSWEEIGNAVNDLICAVSQLDNAGFHGPYSLALTPNRYNLLFRRYPQGNMTEIDHVKSIVTEEVIKAPSIDAGGVLLASGRQFASIVLGQDLMTGFVGPSGSAYEFIVSESLALRLLQPASVCVLH
jgi:uncharacterized linocin/CFP29 family protein